MRSTYLSFTQSPYFNPAFNSAIFDGPLRIYFAQMQESLGLRIYFYLQQNHASALARAREIHRQSGKNLMILVYPSRDCFLQAFPGAGETRLQIGSIESDDVLGVHGTPDELDLTRWGEAALQLLQDWEEPSPIEPPPLEIA